MKNICVIVSLVFSIGINLTYGQKEVIYEKVDNTVKLMWFADEIPDGLSGFLIEKKNDDTEWKKIGKVNFGMDLHNLSCGFVSDKLKKTLTNDFNELTTKRDFLKSDKINAFIANNPDDAKMILWILSSDFNMSLLSGFAFVDMFDSSVSCCKYRITSIVNDKHEAAVETSQIKSEDNLQMAYQPKIEISETGGKKNLQVSMMESTFIQNNMLFFNAYVIQNDSTKLYTSEMKSLPSKKEGTYVAELSLENIDITKKHTIYVTPITNFNTSCSPIAFHYQP